MRLFLAEKKSQGHDLADVLNHGQPYVDQGSHIILSNQDIVTWCAGHLLELAPPDYYSEALKKWSIKELPIFPEHWYWLPQARTKNQLGVIAKLLKTADEVVVSSDFDREGQLLAVNVLNYCDYHGKTLRIKLTATDKTSIERALDNVEDLENTMSLYRSAVARSHCDWLVGMNLTRLFSCLASASGQREVVNIGRVITPTVNLVVERDKAIANFKPKDFFEIEVEIAVQNGTFKAKWVPDEKLCDSDGHCIDRLQAEAVFNKIKGKNLVITGVDRSKSQEFPPLPFSQSKLQIYAARHFNLKPVETLEICQALYDSRHKLTTYPRTDCQYLPTSQLADAPRILQELAKDPALTGIVAGCDLNRKSRAFSDKKMQGHPHNAIIPSLGKQDPSGLTPTEFKIYNIIRLFYIAQFYAPAEYDVLSVKAECEGEQFVVRGRTLVKPGYRVIFHESDLDDDDEGKAKQGTENKPAKLPPMVSGEKGFVRNADFLTKKTRAPKHFDNASLIEAMTNIAKYIDDPNFKKILTETNGLGTEPTRPVIIKNMQDFGWITEVNGHFEATEKAVRTMSALPEDIKSAGMTALWEQNLDGIVNAGQDEVQFENRICTWINSVLQRCCTAQAAEKIAKLLALPSNKAQFKCEKCGHPLTRLKGKYGYFFVCNNEDCKQIYQDERGKPAPLFNPETAPKCPYCGGPLRRFKSKTGTHFWKCQNDKCGKIVDDNRGRPQMPVKCPKCDGFVVRLHGKYGWFWKCQNQTCATIYEDLAGKPLLQMPNCPKCGAPMRLISHKKTGEAIEPFFVCSNKSCDGKLDKNGKPPLARKLRT